jgi:transcriptional regulator
MGQKRLCRILCRILCRKLYIRSERWWSGNHVRANRLEGPAVHPNPAFRGAAAETNLAFAAKRGFGVLSVNGTEGPLAAHVPFVFAKDGMVEMHLVRSNPIARMEGPVPALLAVQGPDAYVSPDWYGVPDQVPTWNYVAVHCYGIVRILDDALPVLQATMRLYEPEYEAQWDSLPELYQSRMKSGIIALEVDVHTLEGNYKLSQNKTDDEKERIMATLLSSNRTEIQEIGAYMKRVKVQTNQPTN